MAQASSIEWTDATWNPVVGCSKVSPGCANCYAEGVARRFPGKAGADPWKPWTPANAKHNVVLHPDRIDQPLRWRKPRLVFVNSMSDLFHDEVPMEFIGRVFRAMQLAERHTFQVLTKRPDRMARILRIWQDNGTWGGKPLPNVWLGTSIENNRHAFRADHLRDTPAAIRFISAEPLLGSLSTLSLIGIDWLIAGGESGPGARPMHPEWVRDLRDRCNVAGTAFFFKQWGAWAPDAPDRESTAWKDVPQWIENHGGGHVEAHNPHPMWRVGKGAAGRVLDGRTHDDMPELVVAP